MGINRYRKSFASDNNAGTHPSIMEAIGNANTGHFISYGDDPFTESVLERFQEVFGADTQTFLVLNGTGANVLSLAAMGQPYHGVLCTDMAHIHLDECGAPERFTGSKLIVLPAVNGKLTTDAIGKTLHTRGIAHHTQPHIISITQATEAGTVYTLDELRNLTDFAHRHQLKVHMDGARVANAAASLRVSLKTMTVDAGIDILSFGGTKNGMMFGEAVVICNPELAEDFPYIRKQGMQLASKMRYIAAQFHALLEDDLWLRNAQQANDMAKLLEKGVRDIPGVEITRPVEANGVFVRMPHQAVSRLLQQYFFYCMDEAAGEYRWMTSFDTDAEDVNEFIEAVRKAMVKD